MPRIAFHAPMKSPRHPVPSGDREMARSLILMMTRSGFEVDLVSELRTHDRTGDADLQADIVARAAVETDRLARDLRRRDIALWVTYHSYYKAPDLIGPQLCKRLNMPYVLIEATRAKSRLDGPWARFAAAAEYACDAADLIFFMTDNDHFALNRDRPDGQRLVRLRPFLPAEDLPHQAACGEGGRPILCAGMMRHGDKLASYRIISETLTLLSGQDWSVEIAGDGPARDEVEAMFARFGDRVTFLGQLDRARMTDAYGRAGLFFWPGVNEAYGMVYLEAQAAGLPVVAQNRPGVRDVVPTAQLCAPDAGAEALARRLDLYLNDPTRRTRDGTANRSRIERAHLVPVAADSFRNAVKPLLAGAT